MPEPITETKAMLRQLRAERGHILAAIEGLSDADLRRGVLPSGWSCLGLVKHLAVDVERFWFRKAVAGEDVELCEGAEGWTVGAETPAEEILALYKDECERSDAIITATAMEACPRWWPDELFPGFPARELRRTVLHVIAETATHAGHLDAVRELIDGRQSLVLT